MAKVKIGNVYPTDEYLLARCAPAGYGWGDGSPAAQFNASNVNRTAVFVSVGEDMPTNDSAWLCEFYATSYDGSGNYGHMVASCQGGVAKGCCCIRLKENGVYSEWEWENPPMQVGVEYRTTERWQGKPVYCKVVDFGGLPNTTTVAVPIGAENIKWAFLDLSKSWAGPASDLTTNYMTNWANITEMFVNNGHISITTNANLTGTLAYITVKYTKTTD